MRTELKAVVSKIEPTKMFNEYESDLNGGDSIGLMMNSARMCMEVLALIDLRREIRYTSPVLPLS